MKEQDIQKAFEAVTLTEDRKEALIKTIREKQNPGNRSEIMRMMKKRYAVIVAVATMFIGISVYAAGSLVASWSSSSSSIAEFKKLPTSEQCMEKIGYVPALIDQFENGYLFKNASIINNDLKDESDVSLEKFRSIDMRYEKGDNEVDLSADKFETKMETPGEMVATVDGIDLYYQMYRNKQVPGNYKQTTEDKEAERKGELVFSYGIDEIRIAEVKSLYWEQDGIHYNLMQFDGDLSQDDFVAMATEIIER